MGLIFYLHLVDIFYMREWLSFSLNGGKYTVRPMDGYGKARTNSFEPRNKNEDRKQMNSLVND